MFVGISDLIDHFWFCFHADDNSNNGAKLQIDMRFWGLRCPNRIKTEDGNKSHFHCGGATESAQGYDG